MYNWYIHSMKSIESIASTYILCRNLRMLPCSLIKTKWKLQCIYKSWLGFASSGVPIQFSIISSSMNDNSSNLDNYSAPLHSQSLESRRWVPCVCSICSMCPAGYILQSERSERRHRSNDKRLYKLSCSRYWNLPAETETPLQFDSLKKRMYQCKVTISNLLIRLVSVKCQEIVQGLLYMYWLLWNNIRIVKKTLKWAIWNRIPSSTPNNENYIVCI